MPISIVGHHRAGGALWQWPSWVALLTMVCLCRHTSLGRPRPPAKHCIQETKTAPPVPRRRPTDFVWERPSILVDVRRVRSIVATKLSPTVFGPKNTGVSVAQHGSLHSLACDHQATTQVHRDHQIDLAEDARRRRASQKAELSYDYPTTPLPSTKNIQENTENSLQ